MTKYTLQSREGSEQQGYTSTRGNQGASPPYAVGRDRRWIIPASAVYSPAIS